MLGQLKKLNPDICVYSIHDEEFKKYGCVLDIDATEIIDVCKKMQLPESGTVYKPSVAELENLQCSEVLSENLFGGCETEIGICCGRNSNMDALEYHKSSEINVAVTPLVLILGLKYDMKDSDYDSGKAVAFYVEQGAVIEMHSTTLHFCPCQTSDDGFFSIVVLPKDTNTPLDKKSDNKLLRSKNKWLFCHKDCERLVSAGVYPGIYGTNYKILY